MSDQNNFIPDMKPYKPLGPFKLFVKSNFPFIEATFEALDNYGLYCKIVEYLNTVISNENEVEDNVLVLYNAFVSLNNYVSNYFDNLDVQEEINNKLDEMTEAGTLQEIISAYLDSTAVFGFDTVNDMKNATNLINGSYAKTYGFYSRNDNGGAFYKIRNITNDDVVDNMTLIAMNDEQNQLIAELIIPTIINPEQLGAKADGETNDSSIFEKLIEIGNEIHLSNKNYVASFTTTSDMTIIGSGKNSKIIGTLDLKGKTILKDFTISGQLTLEYAPTSPSAYDVIENITVNQTSTNNDCFICKTVEGRYINCTASNGRHGFNVVNVANRFISCTSYFNNQSGFVVSQGTNFLTNCKSFLNARSGTGYAYDFENSNIQCDGCSSQQNHRGSFKINNNCSITNVNILGDNTDKASDIAVFTLSQFVPNTTDPWGTIITGIVEPIRNEGDWEALTPIIFKNTSSQKATYLHADITLYNSNSNDITIIGSGMTGLEDIKINGSPLPLNIMKPDSFAPTSALMGGNYYSYNNMVKSNTNQTRGFQYNFPEGVLVKDCYVSANFETEKESGTLAVFLVKEDDTTQGVLYKSNVKRFKGISNLIQGDSANKYKGIFIQINPRDNGLYDTINDVKIHVVA